LKHGARLIDVPLAPIVEPVRNLAISQCNGDWIMVVDADERVAPGLVPVLRDKAANGQATAYAIPRKNYFHDVWVEHMFWPDHQVRFFRKGAASWSGVIHEHPQITGQLEQLPPDPAAVLEHPGYAVDINKGFLKANHYAKQEVERLQITNPALFPYLIRRPVSEFIGRYFGGGWRHGMHGLILSLMLAQYQLLAVIYFWEAKHKQAPQLAPEQLRRKVRWEFWRTAVKLIWK
jgi:hypothetical protein